MLLRELARLIEHALFLHYLIIKLDEVFNLNLLIVYLWTDHIHLFLLIKRARLSKFGWRAHSSVENALINTRTLLLCSLILTRIRILRHIRLCGIASWTDAECVWTYSTECG